MTDNNKKISVVMASYKHYKWLSEAIESVLNQTYKNIEFVIVDDCSNDGSAEIIKEYAEKDDRIKYEILDRNVGASLATKKCFSMITGKYVAIMNSDDVWFLDKLEKQINIFNENPDLGAVFALPQFIDQDSKLLKKQKSIFEESVEPRSKHEWLNYFFFSGNCLCHPSILIKKECYDKLGFYNYSFRSLPDFEFWVRLCFSYEISVLNEKLIKFRKHSFNEGGKSVANTIRRQMEYKQILPLFVENIKSVTQLKRIFPEFIENFKCDENILLPFYIAKLALKRNSKPFNDFAFDILYKELNDEKVLNLIDKFGLYTAVDLSNDVVEANIYNTQKKNTNNFFFQKKITKKNKLIIKIFKIPVYWKKLK